MDILVTYDDGTTEPRDDKSPLLVRRPFVGNQWVSPSVDAVIDVRPYFSDGWGMWLVTAEDRLLDACAATVELSARRGDRGWVWCITGGRGKGEMLTGEWRACKVESVAEQIERLTRERDATARRLRAAAEEMEQRIDEVGALWEHHRGASERAHAAGDAAMALHEMAMCSAYERAYKILRGER